MKTYIYIIIILLLAPSCENELPFDGNKNSPKLIINALFDANKETNNIMLALTGRDKAIYVKDATIDIYVNGILKDRITEPYTGSETESSKNISYKTNMRFAPDDTLKIEARTNDGKYHAWSEIVVPQPIAIEKVDTIVLSTPNFNWSNSNKYLRARTTFSDNGKKNNYYRITMVSNFEIETEDPVTSEKTVTHQTIAMPLIVKEDIVLTDGHPSTGTDDEQGVLQPVRNLYGVFDNSRINGTYTMTTTLPIPYWILKDRWEHITRVSVDVNLKLLSISKMQYFYLKALNIYYNDMSNGKYEYDEFLNLPIKFPSNIEGGTGIFGVSIGNEVTFQLEEYIPAKEQTAEF